MSSSTVVSGVNFTTENGGGEGQSGLDSVLTGEVDIPDIVTIGLYNAEENQLHMKPTALYTLTSGELYCLAASKIFHDTGLLSQNHSAVLHKLHKYSIDIVEEGQTVTETILTQTAPFRTGAHLAMMDGLMMAHMRQVVSVERAVECIRKYTTVQQNETPYDVEDALLFWINKICATVRDNLEKRQRQAPEIEIPVVPEMEDLYEDMCDGICIATLLSFYRPEKLRHQDICFNDQMSIADCVYNLRLQRNFCSQYLPWDVFHFQIEDILYLHESLRPNVNAFLADLFQFFERDTIHSGRSQHSGGTQGFSSARSQLDRVGIPDLRGSKEITPGSRFHPAFARLKHTEHPIGSTATSLMNSTDSLMTQRSADSMKYRPYKGAVSGFDRVRKSPTTTFSELRSNPGPEDSGGSPSKSMSTSSHYQRSDSMPSGPLPPKQTVSAASIRLQLEEKKRQHETQGLFLFIFYVII